MGHSPGVEGSWEMLFLVFAWIRPSHLEALGGATEVVFVKCSLVSWVGFPGCVWSH